MAPALARAVGLGPLAIGSETPVRGTGVLAPTGYGTADGVPPGAYRI
ncbi:hypothetical protein [Streptomyces sp. NPDC002580]